MYIFFVIFRKRACNVGINSHHCALADYDKLLQSHEYLSSGHSPGKRTPLPANIDLSNLSTEDRTRYYNLTYLFEIGFIYYYYTSLTSHWLKLNHMT